MGCMRTFPDLPPCLDVVMLMCCGVDVFSLAACTRQLHTKTRTERERERERERETDRQTDRQKNRQTGEKDRLG